MSKDSRTRCSPASTGRCRRSPSNSPRFSARSPLPRSSAWSDPIPHRREEKGAQPPSLYPPYVSTLKRAPRQPLVLMPHTLSEVTGPVYGHEKVLPGDSDLTRQHKGEPVGERIIVSGRV